MDELQATISRIAANATLLISSEEATRQAAVLPMLASLGWQWHNIDEVVPEYAAGAGRVDYCLRYSGRSIVFIEVKRAGTELQSHQSQLLRYAFEEGVELAVLTDGLVWWLYLPTELGSWEQRRFFSVDLRRVTAERSSSVMSSFMARENVISGAAVQHARAEFASQERQRRIDEAFPVAWKQLAEGPDELLVELVSDSVANIAGHTPAAEDVAKFLASLVNPLMNTVPGRTINIAPADHASLSGIDVSADIIVPDTETRLNVTGASPTSMRLMGETHAVSTWRDVLLVVCNSLAEREHDFAERVTPLRGRKRSYFSRIPEELANPLPIRDGEIYVEGNLSANSIMRLCRDIIRTARGTDESFTVKINQSQPRRTRARASAKLD